MSVNASTFKPINTEESTVPAAPAAEDLAPTQEKTERCTTPIMQRNAQLPYKPYTAYCSGIGPRDLGDKRVWEKQVVAFKSPFSQ